MSITQTNLNLFHHQLHRWYGEHGRSHLPWRNTADPYAIYLSEVMLQQTQVKTVLERFYFPFMERFPTLKALAAANQNEVLQAWQGLGYYNRALNLHKTAKLSQDGLPKNVEVLMSLPGIGRNTAHAIAAFAFQKPVAVMEANVKRVLARVFAMTALSDKLLWDKASELLDRHEPFDYNQAMMDLGSMVCTKRAPSCDVCPASGICEGKNAPEHYPAATKAKAVKIRRKKIIVLQNQHGEYFATPRKSRFLNGLYHFIELDEYAGSFSLSGKIYAIDKAILLGGIRQQYSHFTLEADIFLLKSDKNNSDQWHNRDFLPELPMSMAEQKILGLLEIDPKKQATS